MVRLGEGSEVVIAPKDRQRKVAPKEEDAPVVSVGSDHPVVRVICTNETDFTAETGGYKTSAKNSST
jgi:hypothetical protein